MSLWQKGRYRFWEIVQGLGMGGSSWIIWVGLTSSQMLTERKAGGSEEMDSGKQGCRAMNGGMWAPLKAEKDQETDPPLEPAGGTVCWPRGDLWLSELEHNKLGSSITKCVTIDTAAIENKGISETREGLGAKSHTVPASSRRRQQEQAGRTRISEPGLEMWGRRGVREKMEVEATWAGRNLAKECTCFSQLGVAKRVFLLLLLLLY